MKIELDVSEENEGTDSPWWMIITPAANGFLSNAESIAHCITGPFFSREEATAQLEGRRYHYGKKAIVWCASGYYSGQYKRQFKLNKAIDDTFTKLSALSKEELLVLIENMQKGNR